MLARVEGQLGQGDMRVRSRGDDYHIDGGILHQVLGGAVGLDAWVVLLGIVIGLGGALDNGVKVEVRNLGDEGDVEDLGAEAVADDANVVGLGGHFAVCSE